MQRIYKAEGIRIDRWEIKGKKLRAAYFCDDGDCSVLVNKNLPREPKLFSLAHELKHHYEDQKLIAGGKIECGDYNANELIEKGAEVFAAEFMYPQAEMLQLVQDLEITALTCTAEKIVEFKRACAAHISYTFIVKRFEWFGFCQPGAYKKTHFQKLDESIHGVPFYKQDWFKRQRARKSVGRTGPS
jgi:Zn-dependent peptidase ImmA (M78 family)